MYLNNKNDKQRNAMDIQSYSLNLDVMFKLASPQPP